MILVLFFGNCKQSKTHTNSSWEILVKNHCFLGHTEQNLMTADVLIAPQFFTTSKAVAQLPSNQLAEYQ